jgi:hypothetical protein
MSPNFSTGGPITEWSIYFEYLYGIFNGYNIYQLLDEVEQNIVICRWRADQLFAFARTEFNNCFIIHL